VHADDAIQFLGQIRRVKVEGVFPNSLKGTLISASLRESVGAH